MRSGAIRTRAVWPSDRPFAVSMRVPEWLGAAHVRLVPRLPGLAAAEVGERGTGTCGTRLLAARREALYQELGPLPEGEHALTFDVTVTRAGDADPVWSGPISFDVRVVPTLAEALPAVDGPAIDAAVRSSIRLTFADPPLGRSHGLAPVVVVEPVPALRSTALSLEVELFRGARRVDSLHLLAHPVDPLLRPGGSPSSERGDAVEAPMTGVSASPRDPDGWSLRVTGCDRDVIRLWDADAYWTGTLEVPWSDARETGVTIDDPTVPVDDDAPSHVRRLQVDW